MIYLILANLTLLLCYALYSTSLKKLTFFQLNRMYLLGAVVVSLLIPIGLFIEIPRTAIVQDNLPTIDLDLLLEDELQIGASQHGSIFIYGLLQRIYWSGCFFAMAWLCFRCIRVFAILRNGSNSFSFAFFKKIVLGENVRNNYIIAQHEQTHVRQGHTYDILFLEFVRVFNWFNPILHHYLKELKFQHECIADAQCSVDRVAYAELLVAQAMQVEHSHFLHEFSKQSFLKNRIAMLFKDRSHKRYKLLYFSIMPILGLTTLSTLVFNSTHAKNIVRDIEDKVESTTLRSLKETSFDPVYQDANLRAELTNVAGRQHMQEDSVYTRPQVKPKPVDAGSIKVLLDAWANAAAIKEGSEKKVVAFRLLIEKDGRISQAFATTKEGEGTVELPTQQLAKSKWTAAQHDGQVVRAWTSVHTSFRKDDQNNVTSKAVLLESTATYTEEQRDSIRARADRKDEDNKLFTAVEVNPEPVGGLAAFRKWVGDNFQYPQEAIDAAIKGQIVVSFVVENDGALSSFKIIKDLGHGTGEAVLDVLREAPNWRPGIQNGRKVKVAYTLPIALNLQKKSDLESR
ncbi:energy transducer TonB [Sphingobacterium paludis]|uniref:BlaR1 peptidase M56 n=1 Tax=Sphingobacterium paludis TaxID=1476465 RepID=A0A4R7DA40_9SPHI|nr:M56 family metallopeptidase [Sphingobacterium paludis]TDS15926.1 BlaR1 peptidase M56 [Sphingobacterium paludis]